MSELQRGDLVWYGPKAVTDVYIDGAIDIQGCDESDINTFEEYLIPHSDNLAAVARVLAAHPGIGEAIVTISGIASDTITSAAIRARANGGRLKTLDEYQQAQGMVDALAAALNGGTE